MHNVCVRWPWLKKKNIDIRIKILLVFQNQLIQYLCKNQKCRVSFQNQLFVGMSYVLDKDSSSGAV